MSPLPTSTATLGAIFKALVAKRVRELSLQLGLQRQMKVIAIGPPKVSRINTESKKWASAKPWPVAVLITAAVACSSERVTGPEGATVYPGFDTSIYPGDAAMRAWLAPGSPFVWSGYYLPAPCHRDTTWNGKRATLEAMGWGLAAIYVGQQTFEGLPVIDVPGAISIPFAHPRIAAEQSVTCSRTLLSREQGLAEADDAIARMLENGFPLGSWVYLDLERMETIPPEMTAYYRAWVEWILADRRFRPGIYVHKFNAPAVYANVKELFTAVGATVDPRFWLSTSVGFTRASKPTDIGYDFANIWQGILDTNETWNGVTLHIDVDVSDRRSPSAP